MEFRVCGMISVKFSEDRATNVSSKSKTLEIKRVLNLFIVNTVDLRNQLFIIKQSTQ